MDLGDWFQIAEIEIGSFSGGSFGGQLQLSHSWAASLWPFPFSSGSRLIQNIWSTTTGIPVKSKGVKSLWTSPLSLHLNASWREEKQAGKHHQNNSSVMFTATFPIPTSLSTQFILQRSWEESAVICCNPQRGPHTHPPRFKHPRMCVHMHTRWPWCLVDQGTAEIWLCWISKWTLIEFPTVSSCVTACPNVVHLKWKGIVMHGKHYFKGHCCCSGWISILLSDWDPKQHDCMGLISKQRLQPQARFDPPVQAEGHTQDVSEAFCRAENNCIHYSIIWFYIEKICILTKGALVNLLLFSSYEFYLKRLVRCFRNHLCH